MTKKLLIVVAVALAIGVAAPTASAGPIPIGNPIPTNSWAQAFNESGVGLFNQMDVFTLTGLGFETPAFTSLPGWTFFGDSNHAWASGSAFDNLTFNLNFNGGSVSPLSFIFVASLNGVVLEKANAVWAGGWTITGYTGQTGDADQLGSSVPDGGATVALLGCALVGLGVLRRRFHE